MEFENSDKLKGYLREQTKKLNVHSNYIYGMFFIREVLSKIYKEVPEEFTLKGSVSQFSNTNKLIRPLTDIDAISNNNIDKAYDILKEVILKKDGPIDYRIVDSFLTQRKTRAIKIMCNFDKISTLVRFDLKHESDFYKVKGPLNPIFLKEKVIYVNHIPIENHIANKAYVIFQNISRYYNQGKQLRRSKDLFDLYNLTIKEEYDLNLVKHYFDNNLKLYGGIDFNHVENFEFDSLFLNESEKKYLEEKIKYDFIESTTHDETIKKATDIRNKMM